MEARFGGETHNLFGIGAANMWVAGKRSFEWDLHDWRWDGDLFIARPLNPVPSTSVSRQFFPVGDVTPEAGNSSNSSSSCSAEVNLGFEKGKGSVDKKRRIGVTEDGNLNGEEMGSLSLRLGGQGYVSGEREAGNWNENSGKKTKVVGGSSGRSVCQVEDCGADLSKAKDYHRRHKVCEMHSKASKALVGNAMQRFCQQCSRFHVLQEFDEGKRSCRRRLAGHNKRRRKTNPEAAGNGSPQNDDKNSSYILISLLKILSNMHSNKSDQPTDQDLLSHLLKSLGGPTADHGGRNISGLLQEPRDSLKGGTSFGNSERVVHVHEAKGSNTQNSSSRKSIVPIDYHPYPEVRDKITGQVKVNNFDLNDVYVDSDDSTDDAERLPVAVNGKGSLDCPSLIRQDSLQSSPPRTSGNSDSASAQSPSSSTGDAQSRTDRIIFKLFGKDPNDFPQILRAQILDWLSHSPTDIESHIRPGCVILTIYLRQAEAEWEDLCSELSSSLTRLFDVCDDTFWRTGWVYIRVQHQVAFVCNGRVIVDSSLPLRSNNYSKIMSVKPIAVSASEETQFVIEGTNLSRPSARLLCGIEGSYMAQENTLELIDGVDSYSDHHEVQCVNFSCAIPALTGRGFIEIEDNGASSSFFPFIVAEEDVCSEIRKLEGVFDIDEAYAESDETGKMEAKALALEFLHEMGWLLHRSQLKSRLGQLDPNTNLFSLRRFVWLMEFSMNHEWCAVVEKLLNIMLSGLVDIGEHSSLSQALSEMGLLHRAVRRNSRFLVDFLLNYDHKKLETENKALGHGSQSKFLFRPDVSGPAGLTPLHVAAGKDGSEDVLDALTSDPGMIGIEAWKNARDSTGFTPEDYARLRGHYSYIRLVQKKIKPRPAVGHHVLDIPHALLDSGVKEKQTEGLAAGIEIGSVGSHCKLCSQKLACRTGRKSLLYRPAMVSMVAIAAVCVCAALLFKSCPEVVYVFHPFRWELLEYGAS